MKQGKKNWLSALPVIFALAVFFIVQLVNWVEIVPAQHRNNFELFSNGALFAIAVLHFVLIVRDSLSGSQKNPTSIISNILVSFISFPMNIKVFQHPLRFEHLWKDLSGFYWGWTFCIAVQILFLSGLASFLLHFITAMIAEFKKIFEGSKKAFSHGAMFFSDCEKAISQIEKFVILSFCFCFLLWGFYLWFFIRTNGSGALFAGTDFIWQSVSVWAAGLIICFLVFIFPRVAQKFSTAIQEMNWAKALAAAALFAAAALIGVFPAILKAILIMVLIPLIPIYAVHIITNTISKKAKSLKASHQSQGVSGSNHDPAFNPQDIKTLLIVFGCLPLVFLVIVTILQPQGYEIITTKNLSDLTTWMEFGKVAFEIMQMLI